MRFERGYPKSFRAIAPFMAAIALGAGFAGCSSGNEEELPTAICHAENGDGISFAEWAYDKSGPTDHMIELAEILGTGVSSIESGLGGTALCDTRYSDVDFEQVWIKAKMEGVSDNCLVLNQSDKVGLPVKSKIFCAIPSSNP